MPSREKHAGHRCRRPGHERRARRLPSGGPQAVVYTNIATLDLNNAAAIEASAGADTADPRMPSSD